MVDQFILPSSMVFTDDWLVSKGRSAFADLGAFATLRNLRLTATCVRNTIEGFFGNMKRDIAGADPAVYRKWLQGYLNKYTWRYNRREDDQGNALRLIKTSAL